MLWPIFFFVKRLSFVVILVLANNYLNSLILLSKVECLQTLEQIYIYDNEVLCCVQLKGFIVYRFQHIKDVSITPDSVVD